MERDMASAFLSVAKPALVRTISPFTQIYIYILLIDVACFTSVHDGEWVSDEFTGRGRLTFLDGTLCQGTWKAGKQHGLGSITWSNGGKFVSVWEAFPNFFCSPGCLSDKYEGAWVDDQRTGHGVYYWADGKVYIGDFVNGERTGYGAMHFPDGSEYEGQFKQGLLEGMVN